MLTLTEDAVDYIKNAVEASDLPEEAGLRIISRPDAPPAGAFGAQFVGAPESEDQVVEVEGARVFLDSAASARLGDMVLDAQVQPGGVAFALAEQEE